MNESAQGEPPADSGIGPAAGREGGYDRHAEELEALRRNLASALADARGLQQLLQTRQRELEQMRSTLTVAVTALRGQLDRVERSAAWRYGHKASRALVRVQGRRNVTAGGVAAAIGQVDRILELLGAAREPAPPGSDRRAGRGARLGRGHGETVRVATRGDEILLGNRVRDMLGPVLTLDPAPSVGVVIVSRSGIRARGILDRMAETEYPALEIVLVDNASPAGEVASVGAGEARVPVRTVELRRSASFAEASNRGGAVASSELLLFLNDDIRPVEPGWLHELAGSARGGSTIVGATIVDPRVASISAAELAGGWALEQRGIAIGVDTEGFAPVRRESGEDVFGERFGVDSPAAAVSGAALLIGREVFESIGGFDTGYQFGLEDVDLCLRARTRGHDVTCSGRTVLIHEGSSSQREAGREFRRINHAVNRRRFRQVWGPQLRRHRLEGLLRGDPAWGPGPQLTIARTSNDPADGWGDYYTALELGEACAKLGWRVTYVAQRGEQRGEIPADVDLAVVLTDRWDITAFPSTAVLCAWVRNWTERWISQPWLDRYDLLLASSERSAALLREATGRPVELFPLATNQRRFRPAADPRSLDWVFTGNRWGEPRAIEAGLTPRRGERAAIYGRGWDQVSRLRGLSRGVAAYEQLPEIYGAAKLVLDDTAEPTLAYDAVNSRVFDALACGALVLTNCERGVQELFDEQFPTWSDSEALPQQVEELLAAPERDELAARYRRTVLSHHTYGHRARRLRRLVGEHNRRLSFCLKIGAPDWEAAERWGDLHFARGLGRGLRRLGHRWQVDILPEWDAPASSSFDVAIHLRGRSEYAPTPGQFNVLWMISHPESFDETTADGFDLVCVASEAFAGQLRERIEIPVHVLEQATDPRLFFPDQDPALAHEIAFVGNSRGVRRKILDDLLPTARDLAIWGGGWEGTPAQRHLQGEHMPNDELRRVYSSAKLVLCDHWPDMRSAGFRSNRLYDALACGAVVISDRVAGLDGSLGEAVVTYERPEELSGLIERLLTDDGERERRAAGARARVLDGETFDDRARDLRAWVRAGLGIDRADENA